MYRLYCICYINLCMCMFSIYTYIYLLSAPYCPSFGCEPKRIMQLNDDCLKLAAWQRQAAGLHLALHNNISGDGHQRSPKENWPHRVKSPKHNVMHRNAHGCTHKLLEINCFFRVCGYSPKTEWSIFFAHCPRSIVLTIFFTISCIAQARNGNCVLVCFSKLN